MSQQQTSSAIPTAQPGGVAQQRSAKMLKIFLIGSVIGTVLIAGLASIVFWHFSSGLPKIITVEDYRPKVVTRVLGAGGKEDALMGEFYTERRYLVPYDKIPESVVRAFISAEDDKFFEHPGINIVSIIRASIANFRAGRVVQGGSTITQQVAKSLLLTSERSFVRKIKEVILSSRIEKNLTKTQILYLYLNQIYLGHGAHGIQAAARTYFRKDISNVTLAEAALLAGMPQAPGKYSPLLDPKRAKERQLYVLRRMYENKYISQAQMTEAAAEQVKIYHDDGLNKRYSAYLIEHIRRYLAEKYGDKALYEEGLTVTVPTNPDLAQAASKSLKEGLHILDKRIGYRGPLKHLETEQEIETYLKSARLKMLEKKIQYQIFMPDGRMDPFEAMKLAGIQNDLGLLEVGETYPAVVSHVDDKAKVTTVLLGTVRAELPFEKMKWAHGLRDEKGIRPPDPSAPSKVAKSGDVILVRVFSVSEKGVTVGLDQEPQVQGALLSLDVATGNVLAMEGGYDYEKSEFNRAIQAQRQPGSSFKPIIYAAALEKGYTPASIIVDSPIVYEDSETGKWKPSNFEEKFYGDTTFRSALIKSRNVPTIKIVQSLQVSKVIEYAKRLGMSAQFNNDLSISLGSGAVSLLELTKAYALFPRLGRKVTPIFLNKVVDRDGKVLEELHPQPLPTAVNLPPPVAMAEPIGKPSVPGAQPTPNATVNAAAPVIPPIYPLADDPDQVLDPRVAFVMTHLMKEVVAYGTGHEAKALGRAAAGKTGTTNEYNDAWFMGFTPGVVTGVWVGFDNQKSMGSGETGARAALPIWLSYMKEAVKPYPEVDFTMPPGIVFASIDPVSGKLAAPNSSNSIKEAFIEGTQPTETAGPSSAAPDTEYFKEDLE